MTPPLKYIKKRKKQQQITYFFLALEGPLQTPFLRAPIDLVALDICGSDRESKVHGKARGDLEHPRKGINGSGPQQLMSR